MNGKSTYKVIKFKDFNDRANDNLDGYSSFEINDNKFRPEISLISDEKRKNFKNYNFSIVESTNFEFNDRTYEIKIICGFNRCNVEFTFDKNDWSSYKHAKDFLNSLKSKKYSYIYYDNGRIKYIGETIPIQEAIDDVNFAQYKSIKSQAHGLGTQYFDCDEMKIQYAGSFQNGNFEGDGTLYSYDGKAYIECKNFQDGLPTCFGKIMFNNEEIININDKDKLEQIDFDDIYSKFEDNKLPTIYRNYENFVLSKNFIKHIVEYILDDMNYEFDTLSDKEKIKSLKEEIKELKKNLNEFKMDSSQKYTYLKDTIFNFTIGFCGICFLKSYIF